MEIDFSGKRSLEGINDAPQRYKREKRMYKNSPERAFLGINSMPNVSGLLAFQIISVGHTVKRLLEGT